METFGTVYAKAIDDLASKIFIPAFISAVFSEIPSTVVSKIGFWGTYIPLFILGLAVASLIIIAIFYLDVLAFGGRGEFGTYLGMFCMPLGVIGLLPQYFDSIAPYTQVTGFALLAWA
ncbi:hypothetical protein VINI7043_29175, partial [Vibrio nigripulchritudo ATCC 27043]|uniref:hypothetical protein n=1 Tax=Vibrio nigripulchritudo TaxID=28173 RepID=UPI00021C29D4